MNFDHYSLGASLYVPAVHESLLAVGNGIKYSNLRSVIFCTEDSITAEQVPEALNSLARVLPQLKKSAGPMRFIRVRNPHILGRVLTLDGIENIHGFVIPKVTADNINQYLSQLTIRDPYMIMPTLETREVFDLGEMIRLREILMGNSVQKRIFSIRIGGNDLLNCLGLRRSPMQTIYQTALGQLITTLCGTFKPYGFNLTAPVFEGLNHEQTLKDEVAQDLQYGLFGKTAIHPNQIDLIESAYKVRMEELEMAEAIVEPNAPAVFKMNDTMCEPATHRQWAMSILRRADIYGVIGEQVRIKLALASAR